MRFELREDEGKLGTGRAIVLARFDDDWRRPVLGPGMASPADRLEAALRDPTAGTGS